MNTKVELTIITNRGEISIPFESLEKMDKYTKKFNDQYELMDEINNIFDLDIDKCEVVDTRVDYSYYNKYNRREIYKALEPMFKRDNYNEQSLRIVAINYLTENNDAIYVSPIKYISHHAINDYINGSNYISPEDISAAVDSYYRHKSYKTIRDLYFSLPPIIRNKVRNNKIKNNDNMTLSNLGKITTGNVFNDELLYLLNKDNNDELIMDEIHRLFDIDELERVRLELKELEKSETSKLELLSSTTLGYDNLSKRVKKNIRKRRRM